MENFSHRERLEMIIAGEKPDRFAASFWRHFYHMENSAENTAEAMLFFQKQFEWDFMKINPRADYHVEDWGKKLEFSREEFKNHVKISYPVETADDWDNIKPLPVTSPILEEHLKTVSLIRKKSDKELPLLMTVFTPLAIAGRMVRDNRILADHIRKYPDKVEKALKAITKTFTTFVSELRNAGADGIFYATTEWASSNLITWEEYEKFGTPYDLTVLKATEDDAINLLHVCSSNNFLEKMAEIDYPVKIYNWDSQDPTNLPLDKSYHLPRNKVIVGGVDQEGWLQNSTPEEIVCQIDRIKNEHDPSQLIIGPGCVIPLRTSMENLQAIRNML